MDSGSERDPLIDKYDIRHKRQDEADIAKPQTPTSRTVVLSIVTSLFNCSLQISDMTVSQYVYKWLGDNFGNETLADNISDACHVNKSSNEIIVQQQASKWLWYLTFVEYGLPVIFILTLGLYSDFMGRKPIMLISLMGNAIMNGVLALIIYLNVDIIYFIVAFSIGGLAGSRYSFHIGYLASVADTTGRNKDRSFKIAILDILMSLGFGTGHIATGYVISLAGYMYPVIISCGFSFISSLLVFIFIQETHKPRSDLPFSIKLAFNNLTGFYRNSDNIRGHKIRTFVLCLVSFTVFFSPLVARTNIETLFQLRSPFCFTSDLIGWFQFAKVCVHSILGMSLVKLFHRCFNDEAIAFLGCFTGIGYFVIMAFAKTDWMMYIAVAVGVLSIIPFPMYRGMTSRMVDDDKQGALFCNIVIFQIICRLGGTSVFNNIYALTQDFMPGLTFLVMAGFYFLASLLLLPLFFSCQEDNSNQLEGKSLN